MTFIEIFIQRVMEWTHLGVPYRHRGLKRNGCDCTGLIIGVLQEMGYLKDYKLREYTPDWNLHSKAGNYIVEELEKVCTRVTDPIRPGDILVFRFGRCIAHAGVMLDTCKMLFAHQHKNSGRCVFDIMRNSKWSAHFAGAYRLDETKIH